MGKRNKIIVILAVVAFLIISLVLGLVIVFAEEEPIMRNVNAVYRVIDADCAVSTSYKYANNDESYFTTSGLNEDANVLFFDNAGNKNLEEKTMKPTSNVVLDEENSSVVFEFRFVNNGEKAYDATLLLKNEEKSNVDIRYSLDGIIWSKNNVKISVDGKVGDDEGIANYYVRVSLIDSTQDYAYSSDYVWTIIGQF